MYKPYTYLIGWSTNNLWYYGVQYHSNANPKDLWTKYFTSSKAVSVVRRLLGEPDVIQVRKIFKGSNEARSWEERVLKRLNVVESDNWLNQHAGLNFPHRKGPDHHAYGKSRYAEANSFYGKHHNDITKQKMSIAAKARITEEQRERCKTLGLGKRRSAKQKANYSLYASKRIWIVNEKGDVRHANSLTDERLLNGSYIRGKVWKSKP